MAMFSVAMNGWDLWGDISQSVKAYCDWMDQTTIKLTVVGYTKLLRNYDTYVYSASVYKCIIRAIIVHSSGGGGEVRIAFWIFV